LILGWLDGVLEAGTTAPQPFGESYVLFVDASDRTRGQSDVEHHLGGGSA
jgi:hypothetical protein